MTLAIGIDSLGGLDERKSAVAQGAVIECFVSVVRSGQASGVQTTKRFMGGNIVQQKQRIDAVAHGAVITIGTSIIEGMTHQEIEDEEEIIILLWMLAA